MAVAGSKCRCCPYGFHIDTGFVSFAEDVSKGNTMKRTPTLQRKERSLKSPLDSIFSDSMENLMSDLEEALHETVKPKPQLQVTKSHLHAGYASDYSGYRSSPVPYVPSTNPSQRTFALDYSTSTVPPKPSHRPPPSNGRSTPSAYTALGRAVSEIKARNTESPFPDRDVGSRVGSRVGTPIDLGIGIPLAPKSAVPKNEFEFKQPEYVERPSHFTLPPQQQSSWRRQVSAPPLPSVPEPKLNGSSHPPPPPPPSSSGGSKDFASLRRGREYSVNDHEVNQRIRYFSASPKISRKFQPAPPITTPSQFTYTHTNGHTVLAKTQSTCTSPVPEFDEKNKTPPKPELKTTATSTGPLPPQKPCSECPNLRKEIEQLAAKIPPPAPPKPQCYSIGVETEVEKVLEPIDTKEVASGHDLSFSDVAVEAHVPVATTESRACSPIIFPDERIDNESQTTDVKLETVEIGISVAVETSETSSEAKPTVCEQGVNTEKEESPEPAPKAEQQHVETMTNVKYFKNISCQTDIIEELKIQEFSATPSQMSPEQPSSSESASQTDGEADSSEPRVLEDSEMAESIWLMPGKETVEVAVGPDESDQSQVTWPHECQKCLQRENTFARNVGVGACTVTDKVCVKCDGGIEEVDENEVPGFKLDEESSPKQLDHQRVAAVKKLLTTEQKQNFVRGSAITKSARIERKKSEDELGYADAQSKSQSVPTSSPSTPTEKTTAALKNKVVLKKEIPLPPSNVPAPVPARIPRPKISKYALAQEAAETPDEEDEAADRVTPLLSELRPLGSWVRGTPKGGMASRYDDVEEESEESDDSEGCYETHEDGVPVEASTFEMTAPLKEALESLNSHLLQPGSVTVETADWALKYAQHEWLKTAARKVSQGHHVEAFINELKELGSAILKTIVNITDPNGNTALHYAVSHGNFDVVTALLDSEECQLNLANKAGYTSVMLAALCSLDDEVEKIVVQRLFKMGDVNARASQHGQTALMLSVSHGKMKTTELLLACGADVNIQDEEGSTALMCAAEHGHKDIVRLLLIQDGIDANLADCDKSTAFSIAMENGHRDIGLLIHTHVNLKL